MGTLALRRTSSLSPFVLDRGVCFLPFCHSSRAMIVYYTAVSKKKTAEVETDKFEDEKEKAEHKIEEAGVKASASSGLPRAAAGV